MAMCTLRTCQAFENFEQSGQRIQQLPQQVGAFREFPNLQQKMVQERVTLMLPRQTAGAAAPNPPQLVAIPRMANGMEAAAQHSS
eukprot:CAMPEP_0197677846 /NCGR_PEP_ID=MMETSP1338-20131121/89039_1 /TAXON_ID=43686 ORGANISM="Pelagodinium beii, Strain RCC1491" /NCGR_SAMPLE_ID=MMETSP1338 /ASSEMBLY_ACC=CAM_ASM_000754 /LENGTH=84 /DNA_ID=CAMNT_0043258717 /DNA_START=604 /DNA_END=855 /DNA_ORIENTATION=-